MHGRGGDQMRVEVADLRMVVRDLHGVHLLQAQLAERVEHARIDMTPTSVDHFGAGRQGQTRAHCGDPAPLDEHGPVLDHVPGHGVDDAARDGQTL